MFEMISFMLAGIILYFVSDEILNRIEIYQGKRLKNRSVIFFVIILVLSMGSFALLDNFIK
ncbi:hypothetical protein QUF74_07545 [Candidatus Halobeggiatoa sp. HSG11]|nr:hypothetical protein [Candidatus Halobeggiatoa sp. HSG11]